MKNKKPPVGRGSWLFSRIAQCDSIMFFSLNSLLLLLHGKEGGFTRNVFVKMTAGRTLLTTCKREAAKCVSCDKIKKLS